ncbi:MAG: tetratricopeptide repeat protein [Rhodospirillaceae bacterium]|nr:tetratricopeptide repeat protein [Rhodospirillaceae bacterium]
MTTQDIINQALSFHKRKDLNRAARLYRIALDNDPKALTALHMLGVIDRDAGRTKEAISLLSLAHEIAPKNAEVCFDLGLVLVQTGQNKVAIDALSLAVSLNPEQGAGWYHLGRLYRMRCEPEKAEQCFRKSYELTNGNPASVIELAKAEAALGKFEGARVRLEELLAAEADNSDYLAVFAQILWQSGNLDEALVAIDRAIELKDGNRKYYFVLLGMLEEKADDERITKLYEEMRQRWSDDYLVQRNQAEHYFSRCKYDEAWQLYRHSHRRLGPNGRNLKTEVPGWAGEPIEDQRLVLTLDQGLGEQILFLRFVPEIAAKADVLAVELDTRLIAFAKRSFPGIHFVPWIKPTHPDVLDDSADFHGVLGDFGQVLRKSMNDFSSSPPTLTADPDKAAYWNGRVRAEAGSDPVIGLSHASEKSIMAMEKSIGLSQLNGLSDVKGIKFLNLQYGDSRERLNEWASDIGITLLDFPETDPTKDIDDHAALIKATDLVVSVSTATAHFSAAMGHPTWVLLPYAQAHFLYWSGGEQTSIWYPSVTTLTPKPGKGWQFVVDRLVDAIPTLKKS